VSKTFVLYTIEWDSVNENYNHRAMIEVKCDYFLNKSRKKWNQISTNDIQSLTNFKKTKLIYNQARHTVFVTVFLAISTVVLEKKIQIKTKTEINVKFKVIT
jgi:hypothetical protein